MRMRNPTGKAAAFWWNRVELELDLRFPVVH
jgi:hypothetical protein